MCVIISNYSKKYIKNAKHRTKLIFASLYKLHTSIYYNNNALQNKHKLAAAR